MRRRTGLVAGLLVATLTSGCQDEESSRESNPAPTSSSSTPPVPVSPPSPPPSASPSRSAATTSPSSPTPSPSAVTTTRVTREEFCTLYVERLGTLDPRLGLDAEQDLGAFKRWAAELAALGTPPDMTARARAGVRAILEWTSGLPDVASLSELDALTEDLDRRDRDAVLHAADYTSEHCDQYAAETRAPTAPPTVRPTQ